MIPIVRPYIPPKEVLMPALEKTIYSGYIAQGQKVEDFEFNQDNSIEFDEGYRSPGWDRYKKNKTLKWKK